MSVISRTSAARASALRPGGANMPRQLPITMSTPLSRSVGTSGSERVSPVVASARMRPARICSTNSETPEMPARTCAPRIAAWAGPPPAKAT